MSASLAAVMLWIAGGLYVTLAGLYEFVALKYQRWPPITFYVREEERVRPHYAAMVALALAIVVGMLIGHFARF